MRWAKLLGALALMACGSKGAQTEPTDERIAECDAYVAALSKCTAKGGEATRSAAAEQAHAVEAKLAAAAREPGARDRVRARCAEGSSYLAGTCR